MCAYLFVWICRVEFAGGELRRVFLGGLDNRRFAKRNRKTSHRVPVVRKNKTDTL